MSRSRAWGDAVSLNSAHSAMSSCIGGLAGSGRTVTDRPASLADGLRGETALMAGAALSDPDDFTAGAGFAGFAPFAGRAAFPFALALAPIMPSGDSAGRRRTAGSATRACTA